MAATLTSSGTWTALSTDTTDALKGFGSRNDPHLSKISGNDFASGASRTALPTEVTDIVTLVSAGYNINFWPAAVLLNQWLTALINRGAPTA